MLLHYKELHGNLDIMSHFIVPWETTWPSEMWWVKLGRLVTDIRLGRKHTEMHEYLTAIRKSLDGLDPLAGRGLKLHFSFTKN